MTTRRQSPRLTRGEELRVFFGFVVQPFVAALVAFAIFPIVDYTGRTLYSGQPADPVDAAVSLAAGAGLAALFVTIFGAVPLFAWLVKRGPVTRAKVLVSGAVLGNVPSLVILLALVVDGFRRGTPVDVSDLTYGPVGLIRAIVLGSFIGLVSASVFWLLAGRHIGTRAAPATLNQRK